VKTIATEQAKQIDSRATQRLGMPTFIHKKGDING